MIFEIRGLSESNMDVYLTCGCNPKDARITDEMRSAQKIKRVWAEKMLKKGLSAKIAYDNGYPAGFVEFLPIEVAPAPVKGENLFFISDIHVNDDDKEGKINYERRGCGRSLVKAVERYARDREYNGLATLALDGDWMPAAFYEKVGFTVVASEHSVWGGHLRLLWKPFHDCLPPRIWRGNFRPTVGKDIVHLDIIHSSQCWGIVMQVRAWKRIASEFPSKVSIQTHLVDDRKVMSLDCMTGHIGVYIDGKRWGPSPPIGEDEMRKLIQEALARKRTT